MVRLPSRNRLSPGEHRERGIARPGLEDVQTVRPASDPGVNVSKGNTGFEGLADVGTEVQRVGLEEAKEEREIRDQEAALERHKFTNRYSEDAKKELERLRTEDDLSRSGALDKFSQALSGKREQILSEFQGDEISKIKLKIRLEIAQDSISAEAARLNVKALEDRVRDSIDSDINAIAAKVAQNPEALNDGYAALDAVIGDMASTLDPNEERDIKAAAMKSIAAAAVTGKMEQGDFAGARQVTADERFVGFLSGKERKALSNTIRVREDSAKKEQIRLAEKREREEEKAEKEQMAIRASDLEIAIRRGEKSHAHIDEAWANGEGYITPAKRTQLVALADNVKKAEVIEVNHINRVNDAIAGNATLDPHDKDDKKAINIAYEKVLKPRMKDADADTKKSTLTAYVSSTGVVPDEVRHDIQGALRAGSTEQIIEAADTMDRLASVQRGALDGFDKSDIALGKTITNLVRAGVSPEKAVARAQETANPQNSAVVEMRLKEAAKQRKEFPDWLADHFNPTSFSDFHPFGESDDAEIPISGGVRERVLADFSNVYDDWFTRTGDPELSKEMALKDIGRVWGTTTVDGSIRVMKYPPEAFYGREEWLSKQLEHDMKEMGVTGELFLTSDNRTAREASRGIPSYQVWQKNVDGVLERIETKKGHVRWAPDMIAGRKLLGEDKLNKAKKTRKERAAARDTSHVLADRFDRQMGRLKDKSVDPPLPTDEEADERLLNR